MNPPSSTPSRYSQGEATNGKSNTLLASVIFSRGIYSLTWFNLPAAFPAFAEHYHYASLETLLGVLTASFLFGSAAFQVPAGILAARFGARKISLSGLLLIAGTSFLLILSGNYAYLIAIRFLAGVGTALYFAPSLSILANSLSRERSGFAVGLYYAVFYLVGGVSIFVFAPLAARLDWRLPFIATSLLTLVAFIENYFGIKETQRVRLRVDIGLRGFGPILKSKIVWAGAISLLGANAGYYVASQFGVTYAETTLHLNSVLAGSVSSLVLFGAIGGGPVMGWLSDRSGRRRTTILVSILLSGLSLSVLSLGDTSATAVVLSLFSLGFFISASYVTVYALPGQHREVNGEHLAIGIGLINSLGILAGALAAPGFALIVTTLGYSAGWGTIAIITIMLGPAIFLSKEPAR